MTDVTLSSLTAASSVPAGAALLTSVGSSGSKTFGALNPAVFARVTGSFTIGHLAVFADTSGTVQDGGAVPSGGSGTPGGTSGQVQINSAGSFGGLTISGDATLNSSTGALTVAKTNGTNFSSLATLAGTTQGDVAYYNGTAWVRLGAGTSGQFLQTAGTGGAPTWATPATGGLSSIANLNLLANTSGSSAVPVATTPSALLDAAIGSTRGNILFRGAANWSVLAPGTSGQVLQTGGASADPAWANASGGAYTPPKVIQDTALYIDPKDTTYAGGAKMDGKFLFDVVTTAGTTLTSASAPFTSGDVGKTIAIVGAGTSGAHHVTTIAGFTSSTSITLTAAAAQASTTGWAAYGTDDTAAWQAAINAVYAAEGGRIFAPAGISMIGGSLQTTGTSNAQLLLPNRTTSQNPITVEITGSYAPTTPEAWSMPASMSGTILFSTLISTTGTRPVMLGCTQAPGGLFNFDMIRLNLQNLTFRSLPNAPIGMVDGTTIATMNVKDCSFVTFANTNQLTTAPTQANNVALRASGRSSMCVWRCENLFFHGWYTAYVNGEGGYNDNLFAYACLYGYINPTVDYPSDYGLVLFSWCKYGMTWTGFHHCNITAFKSENWSTGHGASWMATTFHFDDGSSTDTYNWMGKCHGYYQVQPAITQPGGIGNSLLVQGCAAATICPQPSGMEPVVIASNLNLATAYTDVVAFNVYAAGDMMIEARLSVATTMGASAGIVQIDFQLYDVTAAAVVPNSYRMFSNRTVPASEVTISPASMTWRVRSVGPNAHSYKIQGRHTVGYSTYGASGATQVQIKATADLNGGSMIFRRTP